MDLDTIAAYTTIQASADPAKIDLELVCDRCGAVICDIESGDTLAALASSAGQHLANCS
ncbi:hypothetical protein [Gordonia sihwensis]|uniref:hypothetical protein n=1 Tax=Gordonia sihwensis TaxID=173559 RepID=UPI003D996889